jgi:hypothetical protein
MITFSGHKVWFLEPYRTPIDLKDLYQHTKNICRYNGAIEWKLLWHLALCSRLVDAVDFESTVLKGFVAGHDLHESYCTDVVAGLKKHIPTYVDIEVNWETYTMSYLGLPWEYRDHSKVKYIDLRALVIEMTMLGHPAYQVVQDLYGGPPTDQELKAYFWVLAHKNIPEILFQEVMTSITYASDLILEKEKNGYIESNR